MAAREDDITMFNLRFTKEMALWRNFSEVIFKWSPPRSTSFAARGPYQYHDLVLGLVVHTVLVGLRSAFSGSAGYPVDHQPVVN